MLEKGNDIISYEEDRRKSAKRKAVGLLIVGALTAATWCALSKSTSTQTKEIRVPSKVADFNYDQKTSILSFDIEPVNGGRIAEPEVTIQRRELSTNEIKDIKVCPPEKIDISEKDGKFYADLKNEPNGIYKATISTSEEFINSDKSTNKMKIVDKNEGFYIERRPLNIELNMLIGNSNKKDSITYSNDVSNKNVSLHNNSKTGLGDYLTLSTDLTDSYGTKVEYILNGEVVFDAMEEPTFDNYFKKSTSASPFNAKNLTIGKNTIVVKCKNALYEKTYSFEVVVKKVDGKKVITSVKSKR